MNKRNKHIIRMSLALLAMVSMLLGQPITQAYARLFGSLGDSNAPETVDAASILVCTDDASVIEKDDVTSSYGNMYLLEYDSVSDASEAYEYYDGAVTDGFVQPNTLFALADEANPDAPGLEIWKHRMSLLIPRCRRLTALKPSLSPLPLLM